MGGRNKMNYGKVIRDVKSNSGHFRRGPPGASTRSKFGYDKTTLDPDDTKRADLKKVLNPGRGGNRPKHSITLSAQNLPPAYEDDEA